jgi:Cdc6-like AAA superfamily ATPase
LVGLVKPLFEQDELLDPTANERINRIWRPCWIDYPAGRYGIRRLDRLLVQPKNARPPCCLIIGEPNHGKTALARRFQLLRNPRPTNTDEKGCVPVVFVEAPPISNQAALYTNILRAVHAPFSPSAQAFRQLDEVLRFLTKLRTRVLIVDELHNILHSNARDRGIFMNVLKHLSNVLQISLVGIGTKEVLRVVQTDQQLGSRFEKFELPKWETEHGYGRFIFQICLRAGMKREGIEDRVGNAFINRVHALTNGLTGETWTLTCKALEKMDEEGDKQLTVDLLKKIEWIAPEDRRQAVK